jgi:hypothetical protein
VKFLGSTIKEEKTMLGENNQTIPEEKVNRAAKKGPLLQTDAIWHKGCRASDPDSAIPLLPRSQLMLALQKPRREPGTQHG